VDFRGPYAGGPERPSPLYDDVVDENEQHADGYADEPINIMIDNDDNEQHADEPNNNIIDNDNKEPNDQINDDQLTAICDNESDIEYDHAKDEYTNKNHETEENDEVTGVHDDDDDESTGVRNKDENMIEEEMNGR
jgi:hypothetical protein